MSDLLIFLWLIKMSAIDIQNIKSVDYISTKLHSAGEKPVEQFFCIIKMNDGSFFRHNRNINSELVASQMAEKIYSHIFTEQKSVNMEHWIKCLDIKNNS